MKTKIVAMIILSSVMGHYLATGQCANSSNVDSFVYNGQTYEVIKEPKNWADAASCAVQRGGVLAEINNASEQSAIYTALNSNTSITLSSTTAQDGGGKAYVWIGGNDITTEGNWVLNGNNDASSTQFWMGTTSGNAVNGLYNHWGSAGSSEPDDYNNNQDALGLSLEAWPNGNAGEWNDLNHANTLYYLVEHSSILGVNDREFNTRTKLFPNPVIDALTIVTDGLDLLDVVVINPLGQELLTLNMEEKMNATKIDFSTFSNGMYLVKMRLKNGNTLIKQVVK